MRIACWIPRVRNTLTVCNTHYLSTTTTDARTRLNVTLYEHCPPVLHNFQYSLNARIGNIQTVLVVRYGCETWFLILGAWKNGVLRKTSGLEGVGKAEWTRMPNEEFRHRHTSKNTAGCQTKYGNTGVACDSMGQWRNVVYAG
jgi:hypothetical protein